MLESLVQGEWKILQCGLLRSVYFRIESYPINGDSECTVHESFHDLLLEDVELLRMANTRESDVW